MLTKKKILFLIHDLGQGGAEKVLVNLVNNMDKSKFDITVMSLFGGGVNEQFLLPEVHYKKVFKKEFPGNSKIMKLFTPQILHKLFIKEHFDIEVSYLEGPSARIISGCRDKSTKLVSWIHVEQHTDKVFAASFRNLSEARECYERFDHIVCVSQSVKDDFLKISKTTKPCSVLYNTVESEKILELSREDVATISQDGSYSLVVVGTLKESKGFLRLFVIVQKLIKENYSLKLYVLGKGPQEQELKTFVKENNLENNIIFLGYDTNPYKYVSKCDLLVCSSFAEGFSTAATEALIVGTPVCTVEVSGMKEMLGENNEYGIVVPNDEESLYNGIKSLLDDRELLVHYKKQAEIRGRSFNTESTVCAVEEMLERL